MSMTSPMQDRTWRTVEAADLLDAAEGFEPDNTLQRETHINENYTGRGSTHF
jgi:hypothetical protein